MKFKINSHLSSHDSSDEKSMGLHCTVSGLAVARNEMGLLSIQTPELQMGSYDLSTTMPGIFLPIHITACAIPAHSFPTAVKTSPEKMVQSLRGLVSSVMLFWWKSKEDEKR